MRGYRALAMVLAATAAALSACAGAATMPTSEAKLREATLTAIEGIDPARIVISGVNRQPAKISWRVTAGDKTYACDADDSYRLPWCQPAT